MIRRMNYTGRRRISRSRVAVRLLPARDGCFGFDADFDLAEYAFPPESSLFVEAYNATSYMRFAFGTVRSIVAPADTRLVEITSGPLPKFRVKVVDTRTRYGLLLGVADKLIPLQPNEEIVRRQSLLPVEFRDLGSRVWRLDLTDWPVLELNKRIGDLGEIARSADAFAALVYPEVIRRILHAAVIELECTDPSLDDDDWPGLWLAYACSLRGVAEPPDGIDERARALQREWIERTVDAFCRSRDMRRRFERALARGGL
jgi:hypothetical protein